MIGEGERCGDPWVSCARMLLVEELTLDEPGLFSKHVMMTEDG